MGEESVSLKRDLSGSTVLRTGSKRFAVGAPLDVLDTVKKWAEASVAAVDDGRLKITYTYWSPKWDEWLPVDSDRIAEPGSMTYRDGSQPRVGQRVEAKDETDSWLEAEITDVRPGAAFVHYKGYHKKFDAWIESGALIREFGRHRPDGRRAAKKTNKRGITTTTLPPLAVPAASPVRPERRRTPRVALGPVNKPATTPRPTGRLRTLEGAGEVFDRYRASLGRRGLEVVQVQGDGNCLFRAVAHQLYVDEAHHGLVRRGCCDYMATERAYFEPYIPGGPEAFEGYLEDKRADGAWGDEPEIQAMCELYDRQCEIWSSHGDGTARILRSFHGTTVQLKGKKHATPKFPVIHLSYYGGGHYDSVVPRSMETNNKKHSPVLAERPGVAEQRAIRRSNQRAALAGAAGAVNEVAKLSDAEATERVQLETALAASRELFKAHGASLDAALLLAAGKEEEAEEEEEDLQATIDAAVQSRADDAELAQALALSSADGDVLDDRELMRAIAASLECQ